MSELEDAMARLAAAVTRLEAAASRPQRPVDVDNDRDDDRTAAVVETVAARLDAALARLGRLLDREE
jgi:SpoU rRNA methylase family enzyme